MKYITEYQPKITKECQTYISNSITPSFGNEETNVYALDYVFEILCEELGNNDNEEIFGISLPDIKELEKLINDQVNYIEF
jgi:hypothetical protein